MTLLSYTPQEGYYINPDLIKQLSEFINKGGYSGIVSGRNFWDMREILIMLGFEWGKPFPSFYIHRESYINTIDNGKDISWEEYNLHARKRISEKLMRLGGYIHVISRCLEKKNLKISTWNLYGNFSLEFTMHDEEQAHRAINVLKLSLEQLGLEGYTVHRNGNLATIIDQKSGKGNVLLAASKRFGLKPEEVLAIGDSLNDMSMVNGEFGFIGGCVGNGDPVLKKVVADSGGYIGRGSASDSIMDIIQQLYKNGWL